MNDVRILRAGPDDRALVRDVRRAMLAHDADAFGADGTEEAGQDEAGWRARAAASTWFVAVDADGRTAGCVRRGTDAGAPDGEHALASLWVAPEHRGSGLVDRLVEAVADDARSLGGRRLALWVLRSNARAQRVYARLGFAAEPVPAGLESHECSGETYLVRPL